jgi:hypothetical protein
MEGAIILLASLATTNFVGFAKGGIVIITMPFGIFADAYVNYLSNIDEVPGAQYM